MRDFNTMRQKNNENYTDSMGNKLEFKLLDGNGSATSFG